MTWASSLVGAPWSMSAARITWSSSSTNGLAGSAGAYWSQMTKSAAPKRRLPTSPFKAPITPPCERFAVGDRVVHDTYGLGRVTGIEEEVAVLVDFGSRQVRILSTFGKMSHL
jgi:hypothetical protein